jgi:hypothetical protein
MEFNLSYNAKTIDEIEQARKQPIEQCIADTSVGMLALFIQKGHTDDNGVHGVSRTVALDMIDKYLAEKDKDDLILDIMEALMNAGFLSREVDVEAVRSLKNQRLSQIKKEISNL